MPADSISAWSVLQRPWILLEREQLGNARASQLNVILGFPGAFSGGRSLFVRTFLWIYWLVWLPHQGGSWVNLCKTPALCRCTAQGSLESGQVNPVHPLQPPCSVLLDLMRSKLLCQLLFCGAWLCWSVYLCALFLWSHRVLPLPTHLTSF